MHIPHPDFQVKQESASVDFKTELDFTNRADLCEIIKDIVAMTNSGGGILFIGVNNDGSPSGFNVSEILKYDPANLTNKIYSYTGKHFGNFQISAVDREGKTIAVITIGSSSYPIVFTSPATIQRQTENKKRHSQWA